MSKPVYSYWAGVASRGHYLFYTLAYNGKLDEITIKGDQPYPGTPEWAAADGFIKSKMGMLPVLQDGDVCIGQSRAIFAYVCKKFGLGEELSLADFARSEELVDQAQDMHGVLSKAQYGADRTAAMDTVFGEGGDVSKMLTAFEDHVSGVVTPGHCCLAATLNLLIRLQADCLDKHPKIKAFNDTFQANAGVKVANERSPYPYFKRNSDA